MTSILAADLQHIRKSSTYKELWTFLLSSLEMEFIFISNKSGERMLPWGTPSSWWCASDKLDPMRTLKERSSKKFSINDGKWPLRPRSCRSLRMPCFHVVSNAFSRSKKMATTCCLFIKASRMYVSSLTRWSMVERVFRKPH